MQQYCKLHKKNRPFLLNKVDFYKYIHFLHYLFEEHYFSKLPLTFDTILHNKSPSNFKMVLSSETIKDNCQFVKAKPAKSSMKALFMFFLCSVRFRPDSKTQDLFVLLDFDHFFVHCGYRNQSLKNFLPSFWLCLELFVYLFIF